METIPSSSHDKETIIYRNSLSNIKQHHTLFKHQPNNRNHISQKSKTCHEHLNVYKNKRRYKRLLFDCCLIVAWFRSNMVRQKELPWPSRSSPPVRWPHWEPHGPGGWQRRPRSFSQAPFERIDPEKEQSCIFFSFSKVFFKTQLSIFVK